MTYGLRYDDDETREETWARALRAGYGEVAQQQMPDRFRKLLEQLKEAERGR
jgi:hypothetical protein